MTDAIATLETLLTDRYSCRAYKSDAVPREIIDRILTAAQRTASWCNSQPWQVTITSGEATSKFRDVLYPVAASGTPSSGDFEFPREYKGPYLDRRRESGFQLYNTLGIARGDKAAYAEQALQNFNFFGAPHVAIITSDEALGVYGAVDCGGYVNNFMLAAQALCVATVPQAALAFHSAVVRKHFGMADDRRVVCGISFGYADIEHKVNSYRTSRAPLGDVATFVE
ncbi:nitroreductase [Tardiphaga sp.]|jgi:nitroreductase|uniref:nitroreductase n=1 Tax=Tardiphaga sp. TaxID=1926292 RepID=UPI0037D9B731